MHDDLQNSSLLRQQQGDLQSSACFANRATYKARACFANRATLQNSALSRCFYYMTRSVGSKVSGCQVGIGHCFNRAFMPVSLRKLDIQCIHA